MIKLNLPVRLTVLILLAHGLGVAAIWLSAVSLPVHIGLKLALLMSLIYSLWRLGWMSARWRVTQLRITPAGKDDSADHLEVAYADGRTEAGRILEGSVVLPGLVTIAFRPDHAPRWAAQRALVLLADAATEEDLRQLRVRLKWGRAAAV